MMLGKILETIIGLSFTYFLLASVAAGIQEIIAGIFTWRGSYLAKGIDVILDDSQQNGFQWKLGEWFTAHLTTGAPATAADRMAGRPGGVPNTQQQQQLFRTLSLQSHPLVRGSPSAVPSYVSSRNFALALLETLRDGSQSPLMTQVQSTINTLPDGDLKRTLTLFMQNAGGDLDLFRNHIETWFDDAMDRLSGIYKRLTQWVMVILGLIIAVTFNVDSLRFARTLYHGDTARQALVDTATAMVKDNKGVCVTAAKAKVAQAAASATPPHAAAGTAPATNVDIRPIMTGLRNCLDDFEGANLPFGWTSDLPSFWKLSGPARAELIVGWLITAMAIALGAPFWFSLLQQVTNIRNAGEKPDRSAAGGGGAPQA
jgi:hypothetical protein